MYSITSLSDQSTAPRILPISIESGLIRTVCGDENMPKSLAKVDLLSE